MKTKLLRKIRAIGRDQVHIYSVTTSNGVVTEMTIGFNEDYYCGLFTFADTEAEVLEKVCKIYLEKNIDSIRKKYEKYSVRFKRSNLKNSIPATHKIRLWKSQTTKTK